MRFDIMKNEKLALIFTSGFHTQLVAIFENEDEKSDIFYLLERVLYEYIQPNEYYGLLTHGDELEDDERYFPIDLGYYVNVESLHVIMVNDEKIQEYQDNGVNIEFFED